MIADPPTLRRGVIYIEDFDEPVAPRGPEPAGIVIPSFSAEDLDYARQQAYADGCRDGAQTAAQARDQAMLALLAQLDQSIAATNSEVFAHADQIAEELAKTLIAMMYGSLPDWCRSHADQEMRSLIRRIMPGLAQEPQLEIRVHPDLVAPVQDEIARLKQDLPEKLTVVGDDDLEPTDLRAKWKFGKMIRSSHEIWDEVRDQLTRCDLLPAAPQTGVTHAARS